MLLARVPTSLKAAAMLLAQKDAQHSTMSMSSNQAFQRTGLASLQPAAERGR